MIDANKIHRLANGAIDINHYAQIGHRCRSETFRDGGLATAKFASAFVRMIGSVCSPFQIGADALGRGDNLPDRVLRGG